MENIYFCYYNSPIGILKIHADNEAITEIKFVHQIDEIELKSNRVNSIINQCVEELNEYFTGKRKDFEVKVALKGTEFQKSVWKELKNIPYGTVKTYKDIAISINNEKAVRAVGNANNKNKVPIIIPCHRVIGKNGKLVGYAGGLDKKEWLLKHEIENV
ncbi:methylated-DNA--[protein]-cysteine S-methyltransferase [Clostridium senegalense]